MFEWRVIVSFCTVYQSWANRYVGIRNNFCEIQKLQRRMLLIPKQNKGSVLRDFRQLIFHNFWAPDKQVKLFIGAWLGGCSLELLFSWQSAESTSAVWCTPRSLIQRYNACCVAYLRGVMGNFLKNWISRWNKNWIRKYFNLFVRAWYACIDWFKGVDILSWGAYPTGVTSLVEGPTPQVLHP